MKKLILVVLGIWFWMPIYAEETLLHFQEKQMLLENQKVDVINILLKGKLENVKKQWGLFIDKKFKEEVFQENTLLKVQGSKVTNWFDGSGTLVTQITKKEDRLSFNLTYQIETKYINLKNDHENFHFVKVLLQDFVFFYYKTYLPLYIKGVDKELKNSQNQRKKTKQTITHLKKENTDLLQKQKTLTGKLEKLNQEIEQEDILRLKPWQQQEEFKRKLAEISKSLEDIERTNQKQINNSKTIFRKIDHLVHEKNTAKMTLLEIKTLSKNGESVMF